MPKFNAKKLKEDYKPPSDKLADGEYKVVGIKWTTKPPILKFTSNGKLKGGFNYILEDGSLGPFGMIELHAMNKLQAAFNREAQFIIPPDESNGKDVEKFMIQLADNINNANKSLTIQVENGWAQSYHLQVPADVEYNLRIIHVFKENESYIYPKHWDSGTSYYFKIRLRVEPGKFGNPFAGNEFNVEVPYGIKIDGDDISWTVEKDGKRTTNSRITESFFEFTAPNMTESDFECSGDLVDYWLQFVQIPSPVFKTYVKESVHKATGTKYYRPVWYKAEWTDDLDVPDVFKIANDEQKQVDEPALERKILTDDEIDIESRNTFIHMLSQLAEKAVNDESQNEPVSVADEGYELNEIGKQTTEKYLTPLLEQNKIQPMKIKDMPHAHVMDVMNVLLNSLSDESERQIVKRYLETVQEMLIGGFENKEFETGGDEW